MTRTATIAIVKFISTGKLGALRRSFFRLDYTFTPLKVVCGCFSVLQLFLRLCLIWLNQLE